MLFELLDAKLAKKESNMLKKQRFLRWHVYFIAYLCSNNHNMMTSYLNRKYPLSQETSWVKMAAIAAAIVFLLLFILRPFGLSAYQGSVLWVSLVFSAVTFAITLFFGKLAFVPITRHVKVWRVWHQAAATLALLVIISFGNAITDMLLYDRPLSWKMFLAYTIVTFTIGSIITAVIIGLSYQQYLKNKLELLIDKGQETRQGLTITFHDDSVRTSDLTIAVNDFLYAEVRKNNIIVFYNQDGATATHEMRMTLTALIAENDFPNIMQCHRSFVINVDNITSAKGNSNGYKLRLGNCPNIVPVSRSYVPQLKSFIA